MYPDYLLQAIFTAFYKAFPQSRAQFNGEIKTEIVDLIFQWVSGKYKSVLCRLNFNIFGTMRFHLVAELELTEL